MSGGHYDYQYRHLEYLADDIERDFLNDGVKYDTSDKYDNTGGVITYKGDIVQCYDYLSDATDEQKVIILKEVKKLIKDLKRCSKRAKELEWLMSGDYGSESYLKSLKKIK